MIVCVHGVPETGAIWDEVREALDEDAVAVWLPGFGCERPDGFSATMDAYADWLADELAAYDEPVDLIGHDWGALLTYRIATSRPTLLRSWVADVAGGLHPDYVWHDVAQVWQTPEQGEAFVAATLASDPKDVAAYFVGNGVPEDAALRMARWMDETMGRCILDLYRSATPNVASHWMELWGHTSTPGLVLVPTEDPFGGPGTSKGSGRSKEVADRLGARYHVLEGVGHWWPLEAPAAGAAAITDFHRSVR